MNESHYEPLNQEQAGSTAKSKDFLQRVLSRFSWKRFAFSVSFGIGLAIALWIVAPVGMQKPAPAGKQGAGLLLWFVFNLFLLNCLN